MFLVWVENKKIIGLVFGVEIQPHHIIMYLYVSLASLNTYNFGM